MPPVKRVTAKNGGAPTAEVTPEEAAKIRASVGAKEQAPSSRIQAIFANWRDVQDQLGSPFEVEKIPISKLRQMRRDPMLGFGLSFIKNPHVRAKWFIDAKDQNGPNAQIAAHLDEDLRRIYPSLILQSMNQLDFGFQAIVKRFEFRKPSGSYIEIGENGERTEQPIWSQGNIDPIAWKPFIPLRPEGVEPQWNNKGEFDGILYTPVDNTGAVLSVGGSGTNAGSEYKIDLYHSLWVTNDKEGVFGSIFGYPRLGYAYRYWWSYWFRWAIADRAFERKADPSVIVRHPEGAFVDTTTGTETSYQEYALEMGARMRSGGVIALPSEPYEDANGRGTLPQWDIEFTKDAVNFEPFDKSFEYLDVQKLRALFIPEQAFLEGKGGTSSRNVAAEMADSFMESQSVLSASLTEMINRWIIPQWLAVNYPEFIQNSGSASLIMQGFTSEDTEFMRQLVQLIGQQDSGSQEILKLVDLQKVLEDRGTPIVPFAEQQRREQQIATTVAQQGVGQVAPIPGAQVGTVPNGNGTGFSYIQPPDLIMLSDSGTEFVSDLPQTIHFADRQVRSASKHLYNAYQELLRDEYKSAASHLDNEESLENWEGSSKWANTLRFSIDTIEQIIDRAADIELHRSKTAQAEVSSEDSRNWGRDYVSEIGTHLAEETRSEITQFVEEKLRDGFDKEELVSSIREHFSQYPNWTAENLVKTAVRDAYNAGTIFAAKAANINRLQARSDDQQDGAIFSVENALDTKISPNSNLSWQIVPASLSIDRGEIDSGAIWEEDAHLLVLSDSLSEDTERKILKSVIDDICS